MNGLPREVLESLSPVVSKERLHLALSARLWVRW